MTRKIFILDDDDALREDLAELLTFEGHQVSGAGDAEGLTPEVLSQIDLLLLDLSLPGRDGASVIREIPHGSPAPQVILLSGHSEDVIQAVADAAALRGTQILGTLKKPFDPDELLRLVNSSCPHEPATGQAHPVVCRTNLALALDRALAECRLTVTFQPKVATDTLAFAGAEVLLANTLPKLGVIPVPEMIDAARHTPGLLARLTRYTFIAGLEGLRAWRALGAEGPVNINMPQDLLLDADAAGTYAELARRMGVEPAGVVCELTEDAIYDSSSETLIALAQLRLAGFGLALDDVGQRQSGLLQLARLPVTELKIDIDLLHHARTSAKARSIFSSLVELGRRLSMKVVAEGVETEEDLAFARAEGVTQVQGFLIARKMPLADLLGWIKTHAPGRAAALAPPASCFRAAEGEPPGPRLAPGSP